MKYILSIDSGTTSARAIIFDGTTETASCKIPIKQIYPLPGWVEHDPDELFSAVEQSIRAVLSQGDFLPYIHAIGITNQRETVVVWDRNTSRPIANAIVWQCRRTAEFCDSLIADGHADMIRRKTGLTVNPYFSASKLRWLLDNVPGAREKARRGELLFGTVDTWIIWKLTGGRVHAADVTNASRTMLYNINTGCWDKELLELFDIPPCMLPEVIPCNGDFGRAHICGRDIPITGCAGDQQAALFGQCCFEPGETKTTYGTGAFLLMNTGEVACRSTRGLVTTLAWRLDGEKPVYALEGSVFIAGALIEWLRDEMGFFSKSADCEALARSVNDTGRRLHRTGFRWARRAVLGLVCARNDSGVDARKLKSASGTSCARSDSLSDQRRGFADADRIGAERYRNENRRRRFGKRTSHAASGGHQRSQDTQTAEHGNDRARCGDARRAGLGPFRKHT